MWKTIASRKAGGVFEALSEVCRRLAEQGVAEAAAPPITD